MKFLQVFETSSISRGKLFFWTFFSWVFWVYFSFQTISSKNFLSKKFSSRIHLVYLWIRCRSVLLRTSWEVLTHREREPPVPERAVMLALFTDSQLGTESQKGATPMVKKISYFQEVCFTLKTKITFEIMFLDFFLFGWNLKRKLPKGNGKRSV